MKSEEAVFVCLYVFIYLVAIFLGMVFYILCNEMIYLLGFGFFGCFMAARVAMDSVLSVLNISSAWLISFISTSLINCLLIGVVTLYIYLNHQYISLSLELSDNANWLLLSFQGLSALFIFGGLKSVSTGIREKQADDASKRSL